MWRDKETASTQVRQNPWWKAAKEWAVVMFSLFIVLGAVWRFGFPLGLFIPVYVSLGLIVALLFAWQAWKGRGPDAAAEEDEPTHEIDGTSSLDAADEGHDADDLD
jgi:hypothetical protein